MLTWLSKLWTGGEWPLSSRSHGFWYLVNFRLSRERWVVGFIWERFVFAVASLFLIFSFRLVLESWPVRC